MVLRSGSIKYPRTGLGKEYGDPGLPDHQNHPLGFADIVQRKGEAYTVGVSAAAGVAGRHNCVVPTAFGAPLRIFCQALLP